MLWIDVVTIFPEFIESYFNLSVFRRREKAGVKLRAINLRDFTEDKHKTVDDTPFGGGPGMVFKLEPVVKAIDKLRDEAVKLKYESEVWLVSPGGSLFNQIFAKNVAKYCLKKNLHIILLCPRYEGIDARINHLVDRELSLGPFILTGGELPALVIVDAIVRLIPGVLGNNQSISEETTFDFKNGKIEVTAEYPQYTRPAVFITNTGEHLAVPDVLRTGDHKKIEAWRKAQRRKFLMPMARWDK